MPRQPGSSLARGLLRRVGVALDLPPRTVALIIGSPRSGTTAVRAWIDDQPGAVAFNESRIFVAAHALVRQSGRFTALTDGRERLLEDVRALVRGHYARRRFIWRRILLDKEPLERIAFPEGDYAAFLASVRLLFPRSLLLFMVREPIATIWSMLQKEWGDSLSDGPLTRISLDDGIETWRANAGLIVEHADDPGALVCRFEDLVGEPEKESARVLSFLGIRGGSSFRPAATQTVGFDEAERRRILDETARERAPLGY